MAQNNGTIAPWLMQGQQPQVPWWDQQQPLAAPTSFADTMKQYGQVNPGQTGALPTSPIDIAPDALTGWEKAGLGIQAGKSLLDGIMGIKQYQLGKDSLNFQKDAFNKNYANQVQTANTSMENRYRSAQQANPTLTESLDSYMNRNRVA